MKILLRHLIESIIFSHKDYIGTVWGGVCKAVPVDDAYKEVHATHGMGSGYNEFNWRYIRRRNVVLWNLQPSLEDQDRVDNFLSKRGVIDPIHKSMYTYQ